MNIGRGRQEAIEKRLANEPEWAQSPFGSLMELLLRTDLLAVNEIAELVGRPRATVYRWIELYETQGASKQEKSELSVLFQRILVAIESGLRGGSLPSKDNLAFIKDALDIK